MPTINIKHYWTVSSLYTHLIKQVLHQQQIEHNCKDTQFESKYGFEDRLSAFAPAHVSTNMISALQTVTEFSFLLDINTHGAFLHISHAVISSDFCLEVFQTQKKTMHEWQDVVIPEIWSIYTDTLETKVLKKKKKLWKKKFL